MKKQWVMLVLVLLLMATSVACGKSEGGAKGDGDGGKVTIRYARWGSPEEIKGTESIIKKFNDSHPDIEV